MEGRRALIFVGLVTAAGFALRLHQYGQSMMGDEMSTLWIVQNHGLSGVISQVSGDAEITPPLSFLLSWLATKLGSDPNLIRLPALIAGTATIPLVFALGRRTVGQVAGLLAAVLMALSPFMTYFSGNGRGYAVLILLLAGSTMAMIRAIGSERPLGWWILYAALSCLAMYTHYTALFVLLAQFIWLLWAVPKARLTATLFNLGAAVLFLPWLPSLFTDLDSPTQSILEAIQGDGLDSKVFAVKQWAFGHPLIDPAHFPGSKVMLIISAGLALAAIATLLVWLQRRKPVETSAESGAGKEAGAGALVPHGLALIVMIALAAPLCEALLTLVGTDLFGARNMTASWYGFAIAVSALILAPGGAATLVSLILVFGGYGIAAAKLFQDVNQTIDAKTAARLIEDMRRPGDVVIDRTAVKTTPVPLSPLEAYLSGKVDFSPGLSTSDPPFLPFDPGVTPPAEDMKEGYRQAEGNRALVLVIEDGSPDSQLDLPPGAYVISSEEIPAYIPTRLYTIGFRPVARTRVADAG